VSRWKVTLIVVLAAPLVAFGALVALWAAMGPDNERVQVAANVTLAGEDIGGESGSALDASFDELTDSFAQTPVEITAPGFTISTTAGELGINVDAEATRSAALDIGRDDPGPLGPVRWVRSYVDERIAPVTLRINRNQATEVLLDKEGERRTAPVEPTITVSPDEVGMTKGEPGKAIDVDEILEQAPGAVTTIGETIKLTAEQREIAPLVDDVAVLRVVARANEVVADPITIKYGDMSTELAATDIRPGFRLRTDGDSASLGLDADYVAELLSERLESPLNPTGVKFDIVAGVPTPVAGTDAQICCDADAATDIVTALLDGDNEVTLGTRTMTAAEGVEWAKGLGVKEVVGEFTTKHPCCAARVKNIHRMSDLTRGVLIAPGETFSTNDFVGRRTQEKGFFSAPVIEQGEFKDDFGGGVSQWATTTFNAAFFAGLDIPDHKAHSIYISRYPFGREATLAFPSVDLKIKNNTPYGVVIWPTYTDTSITVQMWSTRFAVGTQKAISKTSGCGTVTVTRSRLFVDGRTDENKYTANYSCNPPSH